VITGIVVALPEERATLTAIKLQQGQTAALHPRLRLAFAGAGPNNARAAAERLLAEGADQLISWGCAAALSPALKPGDLVLANQVQTEQQQQLMLNARWIQQTQAHVNTSIAIHSGLLLESSRIVADSRVKQQLHQHTGALALDMESAAIAQLAADHDLPCLIVRAIADAASHDLPPAVAQSLDDNGQVALPRLLQQLARQPQQLPALIRLGLAFGQARKTLTALAKQPAGWERLAPATD
jgi:adenosylhomocysteine nucleosidase